MPNLFVIVQPPYASRGDGLADLPMLFTIPFHKIMYERIDGYSLGHKVNFFATLEEAKKQFGTEFKHEFQLFDSLSGQNAIVELELDQNNNIVCFTKIHETRGSVKEILKVTDERNGYYEKRYVPAWTERTLTSADASANALCELNNQYQKSDISYLSGVKGFANNMFDKALDVTKAYAADVEHNCPSYFSRAIDSEPGGFKAVQSTLFHHNASCSARTASNSNQIAPPTPIAMIGK